MGKSRQRKRQRRRRGHEHTRYPISELPKFLESLRKMAKETAQFEAMVQGISDGQLDRATIYRMLRVLEERVEAPGAEPPAVWSLDDRGN